MYKRKNFWDKTTKNYDEQVNKKYAKAYQDTIKLNKKYLNPNQIVFDCACGTGITTI